MKKIVTIMLMVVVLAGCSGSKEATLTGKGEANGMAYEVELVSKGDKVSKEKATVTMDLKSLGLTKEQAKASMEAGALASNKIKGVSVKVETDEEKAVVITEIDYNKAEINDLKKAGLLDSTSDANYIGLEITKENYEKTFNIKFEEK